MEGSHQFHGAQVCTLKLMLATIWIESRHDMLDIHQFTAAASITHNDHSKHIATC